MSSIVLFFSVYSIFLPNNNNFLDKELALHPVHVTFTNIEFNADKKQFDILFKIFVDDFDKIIYKKYNVFLNLEKDKKQDGYEKLVSKYILEHFKIIENNKDYMALKLKFIQSEIKEKAIWLHYAYKSKGKSKKIELRNSLMTDLYYDQTNLLIFNYNSFQKAIRFTNNKTKEVLLLN